MFYNTVVLGRFDLDINGNPTEFLADTVPYNDLQFFRSLDSRIFAVAFVGPDEARAYEIVPIEVYQKE